MEFSRFCNASLAEIIWVLSLEVSEKACYSRMLTSSSVRSECKECLCISSKKTENLQRNTQFFSKD